MHPLLLQPQKALLCCTLIFLVVVGLPPPAESGLLRSLFNGVQRLRDVRQHIHEVIKTVGADPNSLIISKYFPEAAQVISNDAVRLAQCYNGTVNGVTVSIFEQPVGSVIVEYLKHDINSIDDIRSITAELLKARVLALLNSIKTLAGHMSGEEVRETFMQPLGNVVEDDEVEAENWNEIDSIPNEAHLGSVAGDLVDDAETQAKSLVSKAEKGLTLGRANGQLLKERVFKSTRFSVDRSRRYPAAFDYREQGAVTPIKDQGRVDFFLFGTMAAIESSYALKHGVPNASFSETDLVDCMVEHGKYPGQAQKKDPTGRPIVDLVSGTPTLVSSCRPGGALVNVLREASKSGLSLLSEESHHYQPDHRWGQGFTFSKCGADPVVTKVSGWATEKNIKENEDYLKGVLMKYGPIATVFRTALMIDRKYAGTTGYIDGFFLMIGKMHDACDPDTTANHVMTIVGKCWDEDYWILKNSYGNHKPGEGTETYKKALGTERLAVPGQEAGHRLWPLWARQSVVLSGGGIEKVFKQINKNSF
ncbi:hypothetical protein TYRP_015400 [Tyrophagus putrescentiae]|nr:hypothetical protein TYRP_015400 [Tyrophagus putrescentiae]